MSWQARNLSPEAANVTAVRHQAQHVLSGWGPGARDDEVLLLLDELATNAVQHARSPFTVDLTLRQTTAARIVRCSVDDLDHRPPTLRAQPPQELDTFEVGGRGLHLIERLADTWGVHQHPRAGKTVWFEITDPLLP